MVEGSGELPGDHQSSMGLQLFLLGPPDITWSGRPLAVPRRQTRALLYRLAAERDFVTREQLCFLLWPDRLETEARRSLSRLLTHVRVALPEPAILVTDGERVGLNSQFVWSDVRTFKGLCGDEETWGCEAALQKAMALYRGAFLAGFFLDDSSEFELWTTREQQANERLYLQVLMSLMDLYTAGADYVAAVECARQYLEVDELAEEIHARLMALYAATGERGAALRQFERCVAVLERELGVRPLPETRAIYQNVLARQPATQLPSVGMPQWNTIPSLAVPLVGRQWALNRLEWAYWRTCAGHGGIVLISGEAGIGKSRLMEHFGTSLTGEHTLLTGAGHPDSTLLPYHPIVQMLRSALILPGTTERVPVTWLAEASRLLPELRTLRPDLPRPLRAEPDQARGRLFEALYQLTLGIIAHRPPVVMFLDDLHWADGGTLDWLAYIGRCIGNHRLQILAAYRSEEADAMVAIDRLRHALQPAGVLVEVRLEGLGESDVEELVTELLADTVSRGQSGQLARSLVKVTGGNPFFLLETLRALLESDLGREALREPVDLPMPQTVRDAVSARLDRLSAVTRQVAEAGAVLAAPFEFDAVRLTAGRRELETMDSLDELVRRQLLVEKDVRYSFQHEIMRRALLMDMSPVRRRLLHRRAGRALEHLAPEAFAALARHFQAAGMLSDALKYHELAAYRAEALFAWQEAETHQQCMLDLLKQLDPEGRQPACLTKRAQVLAARAHTRYLQGCRAERDSDLLALAELAHTSGRVDLRQLCLTHQARYLNLDGRYAEAIEAAEAGVRLARRVGDDEGSAQLLTQIGFARCLLGQPSAALADLQEALRVAGERAEPLMRGRIAHILGYVHFHLAEFPQALNWQEKALACHQAIGDSIRAALDQIDVGLVYVKLGDYVRAKEATEQGLGLARAIGLRPTEAHGITVSGYIELYQGNYAAASSCFQQAVDLLQPMFGGHEAAAACSGRGIALYHEGAWQPARRWLTQAVEFSKAAHHCRGVATALIGLGLVDLREAQLGAAQAHLAEAVGIARAAQCPESVAFGLAAQARICRHQRALEEALAYAREAVQIAAAHELEAAELWGYLEESHVWLAQGQPLEALEPVTKAVSLVPRAHQAWLRSGLAYEAQRMVLRALGRPTG